jgi:hypothetical protein
MQIQEAATKNVVEVSAKEAGQLRQALQGIAYDPRGSAEYVNSLRRAAYAGFPDRLLRIFESLKVGAY